MSRLVSPIGLVTEHDYNARGLPIRVRHHRLGSSAGQVSHTGYCYSERGEPVRVMHGSDVRDATCDAIRPPIVTSEPGSGAGTGQPGLATPAPPQLVCIAAGPRATTRWRSAVRRAGATRGTHRPPQGPSPLSVDRAGSARERGNGPGGVRSCRDQATDLRRSWPLATLVQTACRRRRSRAARGVVRSRCPRPVLRPPTRSSIATVRPCGSEIRQVMRRSRLTTSRRRSAPR